jgi:hypothetical protein
MSAGVEILKYLGGYQHGAFELDEKYSVGIIEFNNRHKRPIDLINTLHGAMMQGQGNQVMGPMLDDLVAYTGFPFRCRGTIHAAKQVYKLRRAQDGTRQTHQAS